MLLLTKPSDVQHTHIVSRGGEGNTLIDPLHNVVKHLTVDGLGQSVTGSTRLVNFQGYPEKKRKWSSDVSG